MFINKNHSITKASERYYSQVVNSLLLQEAFSEVKNPDLEIKSDDVDFDTTITGPWMQRWDLVFHNRHTETFKPDDKFNWVKA